MSQSKDGGASGKGADASSQSKGDAASGKALGADAFLHPQSMVTPGVLGALAMAVTNSVAPMIAIDRHWTGLILAFIFGMVAIVNATTTFEKILYYVINSLVIFTVAVGTNQVGVAAQGASVPSKASLILEEIFPRALAANAHQGVAPHYLIHDVQFFQSWFPAKPGVASPVTPAPAPPSFNLSTQSKDWSVLYGDFQDKKAAEEQAAKINEQTNNKFSATVTDQHPGQTGWSVVLQKGVTLPEAIDTQQGTMGSMPMTKAYLWNPDTGVAIGKPHG